MKINNSIRSVIQKMRKKSNNEKEGASVRFSRFFLVFLLAVLIVSASALVLFKKSLYDKEINPFESCSVLEGNCMDNTSCAFYSSCGDSGLQSCRIYDCGNDYGIYSVDRNGKIGIKREAKPDYKAIEAEKDACKGSMEILEQTCVDNKYQAKVRIVTKSDCKIGSFFIFDENDQSQPNSFIRADDNTYVITADVCRKITDIIPASQNGMALEF